MRRSWAGYVITPGSGLQNYPPVIEDTPQRRQAAFEAWKNSSPSSTAGDEARPGARVEHSSRLAGGDAGRISIQTKAGAFGELEAKEALRRFIERASGALFPNHTNGPAQGSVGLKDLSLVSFTDDGNFYRAVYRQANYPFPISGGYGELRLAVGKNGTLLQLNDRIIPALDLPTRPRSPPQSLVDKMVGREFGYTNSRTTAEL